MNVSDFDFFVANHDDLLVKFRNKYIVILNCIVILAANSMKEAISEAREKGLKDGDYIVQLCSEGDSAYSASFCTQIIVD